MTDIASVPLNSVILDDRQEEELVKQANLKVFNASGGLLNDFSENSAINAIAQGLAFAGSEILYKANQLPLAFVVDFLKVTGLQRKLGTKATVTLTFSLTSALNNSYFIPQGFEVIDDAGQYSFFTDAALEIPAGLTQGSVTATAESVGSKYNLAAYAISKATQPLTYLAGVVNTSPAAGGTDEETQEQAIERGLVELRTKNPVSADDFEFLAESILGEGSRAIAIGLLAANKTLEQLGAVHLFLLNADGSPANNAQLNLVRESLRPKTQLGTSLYTSPMETLDIGVELTAKIISDNEPEDIADELWGVFQDYLNPATYPTGKSVLVNELEYVFRSTGLVGDIQQVLINDDALNIPLPKNYTLPIAYSLNLRLISPDGFPYEILRGAGEGDLGDYGAEDVGI